MLNWSPESPAVRSSARESSSDLREAGAVHRRHPVAQRGQVLRASDLLRMSILELPAGIPHALRAVAREPLARLRLRQLLEGDPSVRIAGEAGAAERLPGSLACACWGVQHGVNILRTHDVEATRQAVRMTEALLADRTGPQSG